MSSIAVYQSFFETSLNAMIIVTLSGEMLEVNKAACTLFGYEKEELLKKNRTDLVDTNEVGFKEMLTERNTFGFANSVVTGIRKSGERFPLKVSINITEAPDGKPVVCIVGTDISQQKIQEQELMQLLADAKKMHQQEEDSRILLESVLDGITDGFFIVDLSWNVVFWNKAAEHILRKSAKTLIGKNLWESFPDMACMRLHPDFIVLTAQKKSVRFREYFPQYNIWAEVSAYPSEKNISVYFKDVTEVKNLRTLEKLEREVLEMNARPHSVLEDTISFYLSQIQQMHSGILCALMRHENGRLYHWVAPDFSEKFRKAIDGINVGDNQGCCGAAAYRREKVIVTDIENDPVTSQFAELAREEGLKACWSFPMINANNAVLGTFAAYYRTGKAPSQDEESNLERAKNLLMVIIENKTTLEAVKASNRKYDMVAMATNDAIWDWDIESDVVVRTGQGLEVLFGYDPHEASEDNDFWRKRIHPDDIEAVQQKQRKAIEDREQMYWEDEYRFKKSDGRYAYVFDKGYIIRDANGRAQRLIGATRDITERKESEALLLELNNRLKQRADELARSNVELERFAYIASHDMQEPLRMITSFLQLFKKKYEDQIDETAEQYIHFAMDGADRMKKLIMDLLEYSRVGSNKDDLAQIDTNALVHDVVNVFMASIDELKATVAVDPLPALLANRTQLFQLFQNLLGNALKYHGQEPVYIHIGGKEEKDHFVFFVKDNGIGIKPVFFEKIFVLFQRLHHKNEYSGTGIGLAICKKIVERHGGRIWVESEPGKGSCFYFTISKTADLYR